MCFENETKKLAIQQVVIWGKWCEMNLLNDKVAKKRWRNCQSGRGRKKRARRTGCCRSSRFSRELVPDSGRGTAAGDWYVCEGSGGSAGAGITLQAGKSLWRWWRGSRLLSDGCLHVQVHTHTCPSVHTDIRPLGKQSRKKTLQAELPWTYTLFHICFSKKCDFYFQNKQNGAQSSACVQ